MPQSSQPDFQHLPTRLGVYTLTRLLGRQGDTDLYFARQSHVERGTVVQVLREGNDKDAADSFLRMVRARSAAELPHVSAVLESMMSGSTWYLTYEQPLGKNLTQLAAKGAGLTPAQACMVIAAHAELYQAAAEQGIPVEPLPADSIFVQKEEGVEFLSPVLPDPVPTPDEQQNREQQAALAALVEPLLLPNMSGLTRVQTLLQWMRDGYEGQHITWGEVGATANTIREQLAPLLSTRSVHNLNTRSVETRINQRQEQRRLRRRALRFGICAATVVLMGVLGALLAPDKATETLPNPDGGYVYCRVEGMPAPVRVCIRPVSIGEYNQFLNAYSDPHLGITKRNEINRGIPAQYAAHTPLEWQKQLDAATNGTSWQGTELTTDSPVCGVSYWDALAYANYKDAQLPPAHVVESLHSRINDPGLQEWTTTKVPANTVYQAGLLIWQSKAPGPFAEPDTAARSTNRTFRILFPEPTTTD